MNELFLDTNVFLRHLLDDDPLKSSACLALIEGLEQRTRSAWTSDLVVAELVFILSNKRTYNRSRPEIRDSLLPLVLLPGLKLVNKRLYRRIFELYTTVPIDYIDCYHAALVERRELPELYSYDTDFDDISTVKRREP